MTPDHCARLGILRLAWKCNLRLCCGSVISIESSIMTIIVREIASFEPVFIFVFGLQPSILLELVFQHGCLAGLQGMVPGEQQTHENCWLPRGVLK